MELAANKAEIAVGLVINKLTVLLSEEEKHLLKGIHGEVSTVHGDILSIPPLLKYAANTTIKAEKEAYKRWAEELEEAARRLEDEIDKYTFQMRQLPQWIQRFSYFFKILQNLKILIRGNPRIAMMKKYDFIKKSCEDYHNEFVSASQEAAVVVPHHQKSVSTITTPTASTWWEDPRMNPLYLKKPLIEAFVDLESPVDSLAESLLDNKLPKRTVVALVGGGGIGKTALARKVYERVKGDFDCYAWITASQPFKQEDLPRNLINSVRFNNNNPEPSSGAAAADDEDFLQRTLGRDLQEKRYFVVFDNASSLDFLNDVEAALVDNNNGSRILITSRDKNIDPALSTRLSLEQAYELLPLTKDMAAEVFYYKVFRFEFDYDPDPNAKRSSKQAKFYQSLGPKLINLSRLISECCGGLPLAISVVAGLLSTKNRNVQEWEKVCQTLKLEKRNNPRDLLSKILDFCFNDLPYHLKSCFLYFGVYPKDYRIRCPGLFRQWIAEGFVINTRKHPIKLESVAREYLIQLARRGLVQVSLAWRKRTKNCYVHSFVHEFIVSKTKELNFSRVISEEDGSSSSTATATATATRRLSFVNTNLNSSSISNNCANVRGIFLFNKNGEHNYVQSLIKSFKLLNVIVFDHASFDCLPKNVGDLFHLRYLSMKNTGVRKLPKSIGKLHNLETLDLTETEISEIPKEINRLSKLKYLLAYRRDSSNPSYLSRSRGVKVHKGIGSIKSLEKLYHVDVENEDMLKELGELRQLRSLCICLKVKIKNYSATLCATIEKMIHLESLEVSTATEDEIIIDLVDIKSPPQFLRRLYFQGLLKRLPDWITQLQNLVNIEIRHSKLKDKHLRILQNLPCLSELHILSDAFDGERLHLSNGSFLKLNVLKLQELSCLNSFIIEKGAMPYLEELHIGPCYQLREAPVGIQHLENLKRLEFYDMTNEFVKDMYNAKESYKKIQHVIFHSHIDGGSSRTFTFFQEKPCEVSNRPRLLDIVSFNGGIDTLFNRFYEILSQLFNSKVSTPSPPSIAPSKPDKRTRLKKIEVIHDIPSRSE